jgi:hypothetical protein
MAADTRTPEQIRREIETERDRLAEAVDQLRNGMNVTGALRSKLPVVAAGALGAGFVLAGGIGATMRLLARRSREGREKVRVGPFSFIHRD